MSLTPYFTYFVGGSEVLAHNRNRCAIPNMNWDKLFNGVVRNGSAKGWHHRAGGMNTSSAKIVHGSIRQRGNGVYEAKIQLWDSARQRWTNPKVSTFFPNNWSRTRVRAEVNRAYTWAVANNKARSSGCFEGAGSTFRIRMCVNNGVIDTAFPVL